MQETAPSRTDDSASKNVPVVVLGAYGTGTNWMRATLRKSGVARYESAGVDRRSGNLIRHFFKHYVIEPDTLDILKPPANVLFVCLVKSPLFWIGSLERMLDAELVEGPMKVLRNVESSDRIRSPAVMVSARRELEGEAFVHADHLPDLWTRYARGYLHHLPASRTLVVPYEAAVKDPLSWFHAILDRVGVDRSSLRLHAERRMGAGHGLRDAQVYYADDRNRLEPFSDQDIAFVHERINPELLTALGYRPDGSI